MTSDLIFYYRGCAVRSPLELPEPLEDPPPPADEPLSGGGLPPLDRVAPDDVIVPRPADEARELDPLDPPPSDLVVASRVRTRVYPTPFTARPPPSAGASPSSFVTTLAPG
jgi:hypothetical protein